MDTLRINHVKKTYGQGANAVQAVKDASFALRPGEFIALVGPSGSGKTTMLAMLAALLTPSDGEIEIDGQRLSKMNESQLTRFRREKIGFTFQSNNLVPYLSALENVELMLRLNGQLDTAGRERAKGLLGRLGLIERLNNLPGQLSGGQMQRVAIARALVHNPAVVLADEPTASLDTERAFQVVETFADLIHEQQRAGIMVTHDLRMTRFVDRVIHMVDGEIRDVLDDPQAIETLAATSSFEAAAQIETARFSEREAPTQLNIPLQVPLLTPQSAFTLRA